MFKYFGCDLIGVISWLLFWLFVIEIRTLNLGLVRWLT